MTRRTIIGVPGGETLYDSLKGYKPVLRFPASFGSVPNNDIKISLIYTTYRPGGLDMLCNSLRKQSYNNYELIIIDEYRDRNLDNVRRYFINSGVPLRYIGPSKRKTYEDTPFGMMNAMNTGILKASGDIVVFMNDYTWLEPDSLARWSMVYNDIPRTIMCTTTGIRWKYKLPDKIDDLSIWNQPFNGDFSECKVNGITVPGLYDDTPFDWGYSAIPMEILREMNGMDERFDYWWRYSITYFPVQCAKLGFSVWVDTDHIFHYIDHTLWGDANNKLWHITNTFGMFPSIPIDYNSPSNNNFNLIEDEKK